MAGKPWLAPELHTRGNGDEDESESDSDAIKVPVDAAAEDSRSDIDSDEEVNQRSSDTDRITHTTQSDIFSLAMTIFEVCHSFPLPR